MHAQNNLRSSLPILMKYFLNVLSGFGYNIYMMNSKVCSDTLN